MYQKQNDQDKRFIDFLVLQESRIKKTIISLHKLIEKSHTRSRVPLFTRYVSASKISYLASVKNIRFSTLLALLPNRGVTAPTATGNIRR